MFEKNILKMARIGVIFTEMEISEDWKHGFFRRYYDIFVVIVSMFYLVMVFYGGFGAITFGVGAFLMGVFFGEAKYNKRIGIFFVFLVVLGTTMSIIPLKDYIKEPTNTVEKINNG